MQRSSRLLVPFALGLLASSAPSQGITTRVSVDSAGFEGSGPSLRPEVSGDGRYVVFSSTAPLAPGDLNSIEDVYRRDRQTGTTLLVSVNPSNQAGNGPSSEPTVSGDGRWVAFESAASDLVSGDTNGRTDVFLKDMQSGQIQIASRGPGGVLADGDSGAADLSEDGRWLAFHSRASNLLAVPDSFLSRDVFLFHRPTGLLDRVSVSTGGGEPNGWSHRPSVSSDGAFVAFDSDADDLVLGDTNGQGDVFRHERATGKTIRISVDSSGAEANGGSLGASISGDGQRVTYESVASNLVAGDTNGDRDVFGYLVSQKLTLRVSTTSLGGQAQGTSNAPQISSDGTRVAFHSFAPDLVPGDSNGSSDVFLKDLGSQQVILLSNDSFGNPGAQSYWPSLDSSGHRVAYQTLSSWPGDTNLVEDVYLSDPVPGGRNYCTAGTSASGCQVSLGTTGTPSLSLSSGYTITAGALEGSKDGIFFFGTSGRQANSWGNGSSFQCVVPPVKRTGLRQGGGTNGACNGSASLDFNAWMTANPNRAPEVGILTQMQFWYRDPGSTSNQTTSLSDALELVVAP